MRYRTSDARCPQCDIPLQPAPPQSDAVAACERCDGLWFEPASFFSLLHGARPEARTELMVHNDGSPRRKCPTCKQQMDIAWMDFLQLDQCQAHGIWFDKNEFDRALSGETGTLQVSSQIEVSEWLRKNAWKRR